MIEHEKRIQITKSQLERLAMQGKEVETLKEGKIRLLNQRMDMLKANAIIDLVRKLAKVYKADILDDYSSSKKLVVFAKSLKDKQLREFGVPSKLWPCLQHLDEV